MSGESYDQDVQRLVKAAEEHISALNRGVLESSLWYAVEAALAPFRPDPEEELIQAMTEAYLNYTGPGTMASHAMRDVLAVVKEKGIPQ